MAVDSCSMHKLSLIGGEISLTLTAVAAARPTSAAACHLKWHCCNFRQQRANTLSINYMVECALVQQTHTVNTYVSCRSSLHSNPQHPSACLLRSASPEVGCFHGNQAAAFDDGSHEMTPADNAGSSKSPRGRMDGWAGGWRWRGSRGDLMEKKTIISRRNWVTQTTAEHASLSQLERFTWHQSQGSDKNTVNQMRRSGDASQPHQEPAWFTCLMLIHVS